MSCSVFVFGVILKNGLMVMVLHVGRVLKCVFIMTESDRPEMTLCG